MYHPIRKKSNGLLIGLLKMLKIKKPLIYKGFFNTNGGGGGIRTHERFNPLPVFKTGAFNHSATPPKEKSIITIIYDYATPLQ